MSTEPNASISGAAHRGGFWLRYSLISALCTLLLPGLVLSMCMLGNGFSMAETAQHLLAQVQTERRNLLVVGLPAVVPFALLAIVLLIYRRWRGPQGSNMVAAFGMLAIVLLLIWANAIFWPLFLPGRSYPGWPHGLEMVIVPIFFAPVGMLVAVAIAMIFQRGR